VLVSQRATQTSPDHRRIARIEHPRLMDGPSIRFAAFSGILPHPARRGFSMAGHGGRRLAVRPCGWPSLNPVRRRSQGSCVSPPRIDIPRHACPSGSAGSFEVSPALGASFASSPHHPIVHRYLVPRSQWLCLHGWVARSWGGLTARQMEPGTRHAGRTVRGDLGAEAV
jgi:hypothetical protein